MSQANAETGDGPDRQGWRLRARMRYLYHGSSPAAVRFRLAVIAVDFAIIGFFLAGPILREAGWAFYVVDYIVALVLAVDLTARALAYTDIRDWLKKPSTWVDLFILATLLVPIYNFGFLRMLRLWTLLSSDFFWRTVGQRFDDTRVGGLLEYDEIWLEPAQDVGDQPVASPPPGADVV